MQKTTLKLSTIGVLLACILAIQAMRLPTPITGVMVNAVLIFAVLHINVLYACILAFLSPIGAFLTGTLLAPLYPLVPVILVGNLLYVGLYGRLLRHGRIIRVLLPALIKGLFLAIAGYKLVEFLNLSKELEWVLIPVLGLQTVTALFGTLIAESMGRRFGHLPKSTANSNNSSANLIAV